ncbi:MAG: DUF3836 domain-containing protein [Prevotella sp.]|nr:DUF3836 domain-containing protein [Prevotella sp.]
METIITILTVLSMYMNATQNQSSEYYYNAEIENGIVTTMYVYHQEAEGLSPRLAFHFDYDAQGRLTEKVVSRWDSWNKCYQPAYRLQYSYTDEGYELARSEWNKKRQEWKDAKEKMVYQIEKDQVLSVNYLQKNHQGDYCLSHQLTVFSPYEGLLLAEKIEN